MRQLPGFWAIIRPFDSNRWNNNLNKQFSNTLSFSTLTLRLCQTNFRVNRFMTVQKRNDSRNVYSEEWLTRVGLPSFEIWIFYDTFTVRKMVALLGRGCFV